jgi:WD40 repeat protein
MSADQDVNAGARAVLVGRDASGTVITTGDNNDIRVTIVVADSSLLAQMRAPADDTGSKFNPYRGLDAFRETDSRWFFGREKLVLRGWRTFQGLQRGGSPRILPVIGPSGSGKSSFVRAGLLPHLALQPMEGMERPTVMVLRPKAAPLHQLSVVVASVSGIDECEEMELRAKDDQGRYSALHRKLNSRSVKERSRILIFVDQFEELFTECEDLEAMNAFLANLYAAATDPDGLVSVIFTLRTDFSSALSAGSDFGRVIRERPFPVHAMNRDELARAIEQPAHDLGHRWPTVLVERLIDQVEGRAGALPLLQFALQQLWPKNLNNQLDNVRSTQLIEDFLTEMADSLFEAAGEADRMVVRRAFLAMVQFGEGTADTRRIARLSEFVTSGEDPEHVRGVLVPYTDATARLITASELDGEPAYELTHEALISSWERLRTWLGKVGDKAEGDIIRRELRLLRRVEAAAAEWEGGKGGLWRPPELSILQEYLSRGTAALPRRERAFADASTSAWNQEQQRVRRMQRRQRIFSCVVAALCVIISFALWLARHQYGEAVANSETATARLLATQAIAELEAHPQRAALLVEAAVTKARSADSLLPADLRAAQHNVAEAFGGALLPRGAKLIGDRWIVDATESRTTILEITDLCDTRPMLQLQGRFDDVDYDAKTDTALLINSDAINLIKFPSVGDKIEVAATVKAGLEKGQKAVLSQDDGGLIAITADFAIRHVGVNAFGKLTDATSLPLPDHADWANPQWLALVDGSPADALLRRLYYDRNARRLVYASRRSGVLFAQLTDTGFSSWKTALPASEQILAGPVNRDYVLTQDNSGMVSVQFLDTRRRIEIARLQQGVKISFDAKGEWIVLGDDSKTLLAHVGPTADFLKTFPLEGAVLDGYGLTAKFSADSQRLLIRTGDRQAVIWSLDAAGQAAVPGGAFDIEDADDFEFSADRRWLIGTHGDAAEHKVQLYHLGETDLVPAKIQLGSEFNTGRFEKFSPDSKWLLLEAGVKTTSDDKVSGEAVALLLTQDGTAPSFIYRFPSGTGFPIFYSRFFRTGGILITEQGNELASWRLRDGYVEPLVRMRGHEKLIETGVEAARGRCLVTQSQDETTRLWPVTFVRSPAQTKFSHVRSAVVVTNAAQAVILLNDGVLITVPLGRTTGLDSNLWSILPSVALDRISVAADGGLIFRLQDGREQEISISAGENPTALHDAIAKWAAAQAEVITTKTGSTSSADVPTDAATMHEIVSPDKQWKAKYDYVNVELWQADQGGWRWVSSAKFREGMSIIHEVYFLPDSSLLIAQSVNEPPFVWKFGKDATFTGAFKLDDGRESQYKMITVSPDRRWLLVGHNHSQGATLYDLSGQAVGSPIRLAPHDHGDVNDAVFSPDSHWLAISTSEGIVSLRRMDGGAAGTFTILDNSQSSDQRDVAFSAGGQWVIVTDRGEMTLRHRKADGWEESGTRIPLDVDCKFPEWSTGDEEFVCVGEDRTSIIAVSPDLIDSRLTALIQRKLSDEELKLFALQPDSMSP